MPQIKFDRMLMSEDLNRIAGSYAADNCADAIYPAHIFKALLHKDMGLVSFIETTLSKDYFYLLDWADIQVQLSPRAVRPSKNLKYSSEAQAVLDEAESFRNKFGLDDITAECVLAAVVTPGVGFSYDQLKTLPLTTQDICAVMGTSADAVAPNHNSQNRNTQSNGGQASQVAKYCSNKNEEASCGKIGEIIGFEKETELIFEILGRKNKPNLLILGEAGVGKTSMLNAFFLRLAAGKVPGFLSDAVAWELDLTSLGADASYKGEVEDRFKNILNELESLPGSVLVIESIDKLFDKQSNLHGASEILKRKLSKGEIRILCTSSIEGFTKNIETDKEVVSKFEKFTVEEPTKEQTLEILKGALPSYEEFHKLTIDEPTMVESIRLAKRYLNERSLPDSAFDLIDRGFAHLKTENGKNPDNAHTQLTADDLCNVVASRTGVPLGKVQTQERDKLMGAEETLKQRVVGQDQAVKTVLDAVFESRSGLSKKGQPMGSFFFLGPTGTGKTELSKALAAFLFGDESSLIRFDMSEFKEEHSVALLYGAPPGYVGYEEGGLLVNKIRQNPYSVVLFDEIEKAHKSVFDLFLQILDEGKLHDRLGRVGDFSNALILFTSNIGSKFIVEQFDKGITPSNTDLMEIMQQYFRPEFLGRLSEIIPFRPITEQTVTKIFGIHLKGLLKLLEEQEIKLEISDESMTKIAMMGFNPQFGARPVIGTIRKEIRNPLSKMIVAGKVKAGDTVELKIDENTNELNFEIK